MCELCLAFQNYFEVHLSIKVCRQIFPLLFFRACLSGLPQVHVFIICVDLCSKIAMYFCVYSSLSFPIFLSIPYPQIHRLLTYHLYFTFFILGKNIIPQDTVQSRSDVSLSVSYSLALTIAFSFCLLTTYLEFPINHELFS